MYIYNKNINNFMQYIALLYLHDSTQQKRKFTNLATIYIHEYIMQKKKKIKKNGNKTLYFIIPKPSLRTHNSGIKESLIIYYIINLLYKSIYS